MDEPFGNYPYHEAVEGLRESYKLIRSIDTEHPVYTLDNQDTTFSESIKYVDILATDPYPGSSHDTAGYVYSRIRAACDAAKGQKPVYSILQAFDYYDLFPNDDQMRSMVYQSYLAGASAVGYFRIGAARVVSGTTQPLYQTELWQTLHTLSATDIPVFSASSGYEEETDRCRYTRITYRDRSYLAVISKNKSEAVTDILPVWANTVSLVSGSGTAYPADEALYVSLPACGAILLDISSEMSTAPVAFYEGEQRVFSLPTGTVTARLTRPSNGKTLYLALYKTVNEIKRLEAFTFTPCTAETDEVSITVPGTGYTLAAYLWDKNYSPIGCAETLSQ